MYYRERRCGGRARAAVRGAVCALQAAPILPGTTGRRVDALALKKGHKAQKREGCVWGKNGHTKKDNPVNDTSARQNIAFFTNKVPHKKIHALHRQRRHETDSVSKARPAPRPAAAPRRAGARRSVSQSV